MTKPTELSNIERSVGTDAFVLTNHKERLRGYDSDLIEDPLFILAVFDDSYYSGYGEYSYLVPIQFLE